MQRIERGGYSREEILDVLHAKNSARNVRFRYDLLDKDGVYKKTLSTVLSGEVAMSALSTIKRTAKFTIQERYIPEHIGREEQQKEKTYSTTADFNTWSQDGTEAVSNMLLLTTPAGSVLPEYGMHSFTNGIANGWSAWGSLASFSQGTNLGIVGNCQVITKTSTSSGSWGIQTTNKNYLSVTAGEKVYLSFFYKKDGTLPHPNYLYCLVNDPANGGNWSFGATGNSITYTDLNNNGWWRCDAILTAQRTTSVGALISLNTSATGTIRIDNVYMNKVPPVYNGVAVSPVIDFSDSTYMGNDVARYINSQVDFTKLIGQYNASEVSAPPNNFETRYSLDGGSTWSAWKIQGEYDLELPENADVSRLRVQFRWIGERYHHTGNCGFNYLNTIFQYSRDLFVPERTEIDYLSDRIQPFMEVQMPDKYWIEFPLGVFLLSTPTRHDEVNGVYREIEAYDGTIILDDDKFTSRYNIKAGTKYTKAVEDILKSAGITRYTIQDKGDTLTVDKEFKIGTSKLEAVNDLLNAINYTPIWVDANGYFTAYPYVSPADKRADYSYYDDELSVIYNGMEEELDLTEIANSWVVTQSNPEKEPLVSTKVNNNPDSPTSTVNLGRTIVDFREVDDIADQATLNAYVERIAFEASQVFGKLKFKTALMPFHEYADVLHIKYDALKVDYKFSETAWKMTLKAGGEMEHEVRRVVSI